MNNDYIEIEARWINVNQKEVEKKLIEIEAEKTNDFFFKEWIFAHKEWKKDNRRIRVRTDGKENWLTYKANATWEVDSTEEVEITVSSAEDAVKFLTASDLPLLRYQEKKRVRYQLNDILFELDFWPKIPMVLEIEAPSEDKVKEGASLIGLSWEDAIFEDQLIVHKKFFDIDLMATKDYSFDK